MTDQFARPFEVNGPLKTAPVAIVGLASIFPQAKTLPEYWNNILKKIDCISDVPASRWNSEEYYDSNPAAKDKTYCKRGGFIPDIDFDPMEFGLPPNILEVTDVSQLLGLVVAKEALEDSGYGEGRVFDRDRTGVILGVVGISTKLFSPLMSRLQYPVWDKTLKSFGIADQDRGKIIERIKLAYVNWEENAFPGTIANVIAGRIANRFDLGGTNCVVDAACASSMAAIKMAVGELVEGRADMMITGGIDTDNSIVTYMCFSKTPAFSKNDRVRTFDVESDGMMVGEGIGMLVLKRLADAERDHDRIYAVIRGVGSSSDGRFKSIYAPRPSGQAKAMRRAFQEAGYESNTVGLIEAHGTGTMAGDPAEFQGLREVFAAGEFEKQSIALGSVKSQIAHTKAAAGAASMIKVALALHHKILPPTINVTKPNPKFEIEKTPFYINTESRPWIRPAGGAPRRAGVSSFGFGGTNFHFALEEYRDDHQDAYRLNQVAQSILLSAETSAGLLAKCQESLLKLGSDQATVFFNELADASAGLLIPQSFARLGFVAETPEEARQLLQTAVDTLKDKLQDAAWEHPKGIFYQKNGVDPQGKVVTLFPGQGSQYVDMGRELALNFPPLREVFGVMDRLFVQDNLSPLSRVIYPAPSFSAEEKDARAETLQRTEHAQPSIGSFSLGLYKLLEQAGFKPDFVAGHSFGELTALWAAGVYSEADFLALAKARGKAMAAPEDPNFDAGTMLAVKGDTNQVQEIVKTFPEVTLANWNSNHQVVLAGSKPVIAEIQQALQDKGFSVVPLSVSAAFHTPLVGHAQKPFAEAVNATHFNKPSIRVLSNTTGSFYPDDPQASQKILAGHILNPVLFKDEIEKIYGEGGYFFVECGPKNVLTNLVKSILGDRPHVAVALNASPKKDSDRQFREAVVQLRVAGLNLGPVDPYQAPRKADASQKKSSIAITLNGGMYVTEKTRSAFEKAIQQKDTLSPASYPAGLVPAAAQQPQPVKVAQPAQPGPAGIPALAQPLAPAPTSEAAVTYPVSPEASEFLARSLEQFYTQQSETLHVHEQYLSNDAEFSKTFTQLTQAELALLANPNINASQVLPVLEKLEASMMRFHDHQAETLRAHEAFLQNQAALSQQLVELVQAQLGSASQARPAAPRPAAAPVVRVQPVEVRIPSPPPAVLAPAPQVILPKSNGYKHEVEVPPAPVQAPVAARPMVPAPAALVTTGVSTKAITEAFLNVVSEKTGYPVETLELDMDMEADLGIDSIKRVEILGSVRALFPELPKVDPETFAELRTLRQVTDHLAKSHPAAAEMQSQVPVAPEPVTLIPAAEPPAAPASETADLARAFLDVVSEKTGYPVETLELEMDMEADLGIDSIKRVEILGAVRGLFPGLPKVDPETFAELRTLRQVIDYLNASNPDKPASPPAPDVDQAQPVISEPLPAALAAEPQVPAAASPAAEDIASAFLSVVSEKTGYPVETLELDMDMEADLGIDSIKRVEILGGVRAVYPDLPKVDPETFAELRTLRQVKDHLEKSLASVAVSPFRQPVS